VRASAPHTRGRRRPRGSVVRPPEGIRSWPPTYQPSLTLNRSAVTFPAGWGGSRRVMALVVGERLFKYHGLGNDFVVLDRRKAGRDITAAESVALCERHRGVGADG